MSWDDYRFNGYRKALKEHRDMWDELAKLGDRNAAGHRDGFETALRLLDRWVLAVQEEEEAFRPAGTFEAKSRRAGEKSFTVWARYVGADHG